MSASNAPADFICPLTNKVMREPMMSKYGNHFDKDAILMYLDSGNDTCPVTGKPLTISMLISNKNLQFKIQQWKEANGQGSGIEKDALETPNFLMPGEAISSFAGMDILAALERDSMPNVYK